MCGLCGIAGNLIGTDQRAFKMLLFLSELRGEDATGIIKVNRPAPKDFKKHKHINFSAMRQTVRASHFLHYDEDGKKQKALWAPGDAIAYLGHTRSGTIGDKNKVTNAHPFNFGKVIGMHNGTISHKFKHSDEYETDSEALYRNINDYGLEEALNEAQSWTAAWALTFLDKEKYTLNLIRNDKRPLHLAVCDGKSAVVWASEEWMLKEVIKRVWPSEKPDIIQPKPDILFSFDLLKHRFWENPDTQEVKIKKNTTTYSTNYKPHGASHAGGFEYWQGQGDDWDEDDKTLRVNPKSPTTAINPGRALSDLKNKPGQRWYFHVSSGLDVPRLTFQKILDRGCGICSQVPDINDIEVDMKIGWLHEHNFICEDCQKLEWAHDHLSWTLVTAPFRPSTKPSTETKVG